MTTERKIIFEPRDVERIEFVCRACGASLTLNPSKDNHFIKRECPNCGAEWMSHESVLHQYSMALLKSIRGFAQMEKEAGFQVRLCLRNGESKDL
jgi:predicted RNA-binding Zn-ribbon protein involved in translation (DUF1610 family)